MKTIVLMSGGMDSTVLAAHLKSGGHDVIGLGFNYRQRNDWELEAAGFIASRLGVPWSCLAMDGLFAGSASALIDHTATVPEGHYADPAMAAMVVPNRNMVMLSIAVARAMVEGASAVAYGAQLGGRPNYADCRLEFFKAMKRAIDLATGGSVELMAPFVGLSKCDVVAIGHNLGVPFDLTWSCYNAGPFHCGKCGTCVGRRETFQLAGVKDPTEYEGTR